MRTLTELLKIDTMQKAVIGGTLGGSALALACVFPSYIAMVVILMASMLIMDGYYATEKHRFPLVEEAKEIHAEIKYWLEVVVPFCLTESTMVEVL